MARAIDADALQELCDRKIQDTWNNGTAPVSWAHAYADFKDDIDSMPTLTPPNEAPPCYQLDGDGCAYQCYDGDDEPIDKCKECPLCYSDKQRHHTPPNEPLTLEDAKKERYIWFTPLNDWAKVTPFGVLFFGAEELMSWETLCEEWGYRFKAYRRPPEGET